MIKATSLQQNLYSIPQTRKQNQYL